MIKFLWENLKETIVAYLCTYKLLHMKYGCAHLNQDSPSSTHSAYIPTAQLSAI